MNLMFTMWTIATQHTFDSDALYMNGENNLCVSLCVFTEIFLRLFVSFFFFSLHCFVVWWLDTC